MNTIDIVIGLILVIAFFLGFSKGLFRVLASLIGFVVGVYCAIYFSGYIEVYLVRWFNWNEDINRMVSYLITFILVVVLFALLGRVLTKVADFAMLGFFNKILGGVFNVLKFVFLLSVIFMLVNSSENYRILTSEERNSSLLYYPIEAVAPAILPTIERHIENLDIEPETDFPNEIDKDTLT